MIDAILQPLLMGFLGVILLCLVGCIVGICLEVPASGIAHFQGRSEAKLRDYAFAAILMFALWALGKGMNYVEENHLRRTTPQATE